MRYEDVIEVLNDPVAHELLHSAIPARLAYTGVDGSPRVVPVAFYWDGAQLAIGTTPRAPKVRALEKNPKVALTVDTNKQPPHVLLVRGIASIAVVDGVPSEYLQASKKLVDEEGWEAFEAEVRAMYEQMALITITPQWAKVMDFETRIPGILTELIEERKLRSS